MVCYSYISFIGLFLQSIFIITAILMYFRGGSRFFVSAEDYDNTLSLNNAKRILIMNCGEAGYSTKMLSHKELQAGCLC